MVQLVRIIRTTAVDIYSLKRDGSGLTDAEEFLEYGELLKPQQLKEAFSSILGYIRSISNCGARENLFRREGKSVSALPLLAGNTKGIDRRVGKLRLYCIRISEQILIIGKGLVTKAAKNKDDPKIMEIISELEDIEHLIWKQASRSNVDYDDYPEMTKILNSIKI